MSAIDSLQRLVDHCEGIPDAQTSVDRLAELNLDPAEFQKARPLRNALAEVSKYLKPIITDSARSTKIASLPNALQSKIENLANNTDSILQKCMPY